MEVLVPTEHQLQTARAGNFALGDVTLSPRTEQEEHEATKTKTHRIVDNPLDGDKNAQAAHYDRIMG